MSERELPRRDLTLAIEELGHRVAPAAAVREAVDLLGEARPQLLVVACDPGSKLAEHVLGEVDRVQPLLPVIVALERRSAARAVDLLRAGAYEVVVPPWTADNLSPCVTKALRFKGTAFEAAPPFEERKRAASYAGLVAAFLLAAGGYQALRPKPKPAPPAPATRSWKLPYAHPGGLAFHAGELWATDWFAQTLYTLDPKTLAVRRAVHYPKETPAALAVLQDVVWVSASPGVLVRHMKDDRLTPLARLPDRGGRTVGLAYDGLYLWSLDAKAKKIHKRLFDDSLSVVESYDYPGVEPAALAWDGRTLWSVDAANKELLRHDVAQPSNVTLRTTLPEYQQGNFRPVGLAWDGERFWTLADNIRSPGQVGRIFRHFLAGQAP